MSTDWMMINQPLPWHDRQWQHYQHCCHEKRFAHAWLFAGLAGMGKYYFARRVAQSRLCMQPDHERNACGYCRSCQLFVAGNHPDFIIVQPEQAQGSIKIEQIRDLQTSVLQTSQLNGERIVMMTPADAMNHAAMNALLKLLEEPPKKCCFLLLSNHTQLLSATIRSRCQWLHFYPSYDQPTQAWLQQRQQTCDVNLLLALAGGAPFKALQLSEPQHWQMRQDLFHDVVALLQGKRCPIQLAKQYADMPMDDIITHFLSWLHDMIQWKTCQAGQNITNKDFTQDLDETIKMCSLSNIYSLYDEILINRRFLLEKTNINLQLLLESFFILWLGVSKNEFKRHHK
jgi:DNA polymerase III subunit delta'